MISLQVISIFMIHVTFILSLMILSGLSRIFGAARNKKPVYRWFFHSVLLLVAALGLSLAGLDVPAFRVYALGLDVAGLLLGAVVTYFYWEWLPRELAKEKR